MDNSHGASSNMFAGQLLIANSDHVRTTLDTGKPTSEVRPDKRVILSRGFEDPVFASSIGRHSVTNAAVLSHPEGETLMQSLREFAAERGVFLGEGWHVEYKQPTSRSGPYVFYCSPDGKKFESINDVAQYLGVSSSFTYSDKNERVGGYDTVHQSLPRRRRKKYPARISVTNNSPVNQDSQPSSCRGDRYSDSEAMKPQDFDGRSAAQVPKCSFDENGLPGFQDSNVGLPVQYEDFYVLSLGKVDLQMSYHNDSQIWPIGYKAIWHDKITGSRFECEVSNGGESGPVFRVRRCSCSVLPIPNGATVLVHNKTNKTDVTKSKERVSMSFVASCDSDEEIQMYLSDNKPPELDFLLCSSRDYGETLAGSFVPMDIQKTGISTPDLNCHPERSVESLKAISSLRDEIGEFCVEGRSSCLVWKMVSQTLIDACREMYKHTGCLYFHCEHNNDVYSPKSDGGYVEAVDLPCSLTKFCCASGPINTPRVIKDDSELEVSFKSLAKWIDQDRFGLDLGFVQEIIENLPGSRACSRYQLLKDRTDLSTLFTVGSGSLLAIQKTEHGGERVAPYGLFHGPTKSNLKDSGSKSIIRQPPQGRPLSSKLPAQLVGDVLQILELLWRFSEILGLKESLSFEGIVQELIDPWPCTEKETQNYKEPSLHGLENVNGPEPLAGESDLPHREETIILVPVETASLRGATETKLAACTYARCHGVSLTKIHMCLLKVLIGELLCRVDAKETKPGRGRKKDVDNSLLMKESKTDILINELTWPELARRYILALSSMNDLDSPEVCSRKGVKVFRCLQGDGGVLCGSLSGVAGMEADAVMLAQAERQITDPSKQENEVLPMDLKDLDAPAICEPAVVSTGLPEWAEPLEPVRKLPTNVGTRIRKCVYESLNRSPPEWARKVLEQSISKEVYKGNASGPTKKLVLSVLAEASGGPLQPRPAKRPKQIQQSRPISVSDAIMRKCRIVLRRAMFADEGKVFCNMLGTILDNTIDTEDASVICPPAMVSRPLDFRMIDLRLAHGAYAGSHEAFIEDVREVWHTIRMAYGEKPNLMLLVGTLSEKFESLYEEEVLIPFQKFVNDGSTELTDPDVQKEFHDFLLNSNEIPKAPWEDGVCKVCGIDKDDDSVLLCDTCDSEYHTYCLDPPLARIPEGNWYCPSCVASHSEKQDTGPHTQTIRTRTKRVLGVETQAIRDSLIQLATKMEDGEYWEFSTEERIFLLKVLCDEVLNSVLIRDHLDQCIDKSNDLQQKLRAVSMGRDSFDRLFWVVGRPGKRPWLLVDGSISLPQEKPHTEEIRGHIFNNLQDLTLGRHSLESKNFPVGSDADQSYSSPTGSVWSSSAWFFYESDCEIRELVNWLRESDPKERELKENILLWQKLVCHQPNNSISDVSQLLPNSSTENLKAYDCLATIASTILETKYGRFLDLEVDEGSVRCGRKAKTSCEVYRCECLEPVWASRHHCLSCHKTFCTVLELQGHNDGKCTIANHTSDESKVSDEALKGKGVRSESPREMENIDEANNVEVSRGGKLDISSKLANPPKKICPYDIDEVSKKFITYNSNKKLVQSIGLIGSNGIPSLVPSPGYFLDPPVLLNQRNDFNINPDIGFPSIDEQMQLSAQDVGMGANTSQFDNANETVGITKPPENSLGDATEKHGMRLTMESTVDEEKLPSTKKLHRTDVCHSHNIPESSLRPLVGKVSQLLMRLKINMLDMEAALPVEALRPLKAHTMKRCAWRSYVKSSESIFEMVQATIILEGMIKTDYLKNGWWYWSSLSAAAKTPTVSSLAFRIYALDDCINYNKDPLTAFDPIESTKSPIKTSKKRKDMDA